MHWTLFLAFKQLFPPGKRFPAFAIVSIIGITIGVCSLLVVQTVMNGYAQEFKENIQRLSGHITIQSKNHAPIENYKKVVEEIKPINEIKASSPFAEGQVLVRFKNVPAYSQVRGIHLDLEEKVIPLRQTIRIGELSELDNDRVIIGIGLARKLGCRLGDSIDVYSPTMLDDIKKDEIPLPAKLEICAIFETGFTPVDENTIIVSLRRMQTFYNLGKTVHGIRIALNDVDNTDITIEKIRDLISPKLVARPWYFSNFIFLEAVRFEKTMLFFLMFIITIVASFSIASTLFSAVIKRSREIGILGTIGAKPLQILNIFLSQGILVGIIGYGLGCGLTFLIISFRDKIVAFINSIFGGGDMIQTQYMFSQIPVHYNPYDFLVAAIFTLLTTMIAALIPALLAARKKPSEAMRES